MENKVEEFECPLENNGCPYWKNLYHLEKNDIIENDTIIDKVISKIESECGIERLCDVKRRNNAKCFLLPKNLLPFHDVIISISPVKKIFNNKKIDFFEINFLQMTSDDQDWFWEEHKIIQILNAQTIKNLIEHYISVIEERIILASLPSLQKFLGNGKKKFNFNDLRFNSLYIKTLNIKSLYFKHNEFLHYMKIKSKVVDELKKERKERKETLIVMTGLILCILFSIFILSLL